MIAGILFFGVVAWILIAVASGHVADVRGRSWWGGFLLGLLTGLVGLAVVLLLPDGETR